MVSGTWTKGTSREDKNEALWLSLCGDRRSGKGLIITSTPEDLFRNICKNRVPYTIINTEHGRGTFHTFHNIKYCNIFC